MDATAGEPPARGRKAPQAVGQFRRPEDEPITIVLLGQQGLAAVASPEGVRVLVGLDVSEYIESEVQTERAFLVDLGGPEAVLLGAMGAYPIARGEGGEELLRRAAAAASAWRQAQKRIAHRLQIPDWLVAYADALDVAASPGDVYAAIATFVHRVVGAYAGVVFLQGGPEAPGEVVGETRRFQAADRLSAEELARLARPGLLTPEDVAGQSGFLAPLWQEMSAVYLLHSALGSGAVVFVVERRRERLFTSEDADLFRAMIRHAEAVLRRFGV